MSHQSGAECSPAVASKASPAHIRGGHNHAPAGGAVPYDASDRQHDGKRIDVLAELLRALIASPSRDEVPGQPWTHAWPQLCAWRIGDGYAVDLVMPRRMQRHGGTYYSGDALMDATWDGRESRHYSTLEEAVRALLDNVLYRVYGGRTLDPTRAPTPQPTREPLPANIGGDERF